MKKTKLLQKVIGIGCAAIAVAVLWFPATTFADTFTVDVITDGSDVSPGDSVCDDGSGDCSLRAAMEEANALGGAHTINFAIAGAGVHTIAPTTALPEIDVALTIDGLSQTGASCGSLVPSTLPAANNTPHVLRIEVKGEDIASGSSNIFNFSNQSSNSSVRGLILNSTVSSGLAINVVGSDIIDGFLVECNYVGTDNTGALAQADSDDSNPIAIRIAASENAVVRNNLISGGWSEAINFITSSGSVQNNLVGVAANGITALGNDAGVVIGNTNQQAVLEHNIISANSGIGVRPYRNSRVIDNYIGIDMRADPRGNTGDGIYMTGSVEEVEIGNTSRHNVIAANGGSGIHIERSNTCEAVPQRSKIIGNYIGTNETGSIETGFGNGGSGIEVNETDYDCGGSVYKHRIGGDSLGEPNIIAGNGQDGVRIFSVPWTTCEEDDEMVPCGGTDVFGISVLKNRVYQNGGLNINLATDANNDGTADTDLGQNPLNNFMIDYPATKANNYLNHPTILRASSAGNQLRVGYSFQAPAISNDNPSELSSDDLVGYRLDFYANNGKDYIGYFIVNGSEPNAQHVFTTEGELPRGTVLTATATVLWRIQTGETCDGDRTGSGPPYQPPQTCT